MKRADVATTQAISQTLKTLPTEGEGATELKHAGLGLQTAIKEKDGDKIAKCYKEFYRAAIYCSEKAVDAGKAIFSILLDIIVVIGYQLAITYKECSALYNDWKKDGYKDKGDELGVIIDSLDQRTKSRPEMEVSAKTKIAEILEKKRAEKERDDATMNEYSTRAETNRKEAEVYRVERNQYYNRNVEKLSKIKDNLMEKLGLASSALVMSR